MKKPLSRFQEDVFKACKKAALSNGMFKAQQVERQTGYTQQNINRYMRELTDRGWVASLGKGDYQIVK